MKHLFKIFLCLVFFSISLANITAQDKLFTQAFAHPVDLNPAFSGAIDGRFRVTMAYRDQWQSFVESEFTTLGIYGDFKIPISDRKDDFFGAGFSLIADRTAVYNVNQNILSLFGSYHKALNPDKDQFLTAGVSFGLSQRNINYENIFFQDQFNGLDEYSLPSAEILPSNNFAFADIGLGISYTSSLSEYSSIALGFSGDHLPGSSISFYTHSIDQEIAYPDFKIDRKWTGYLSMELASNEYVSVLPRLIWQKQGPYQMITAAGLVKFDLTNYDNQALHIGGGVRLNQKVDSGLGTTAFYVMTAYELSGLLIGLSHDFTTSALSSVSPGKGAFELSISFTGLFENEGTTCPTF